jgi:molybdenum cofactor cytidylyltransferase
MCKPTVNILLLAAGSSSRLGQPKQLLPWKSSNLLQNAIETAKNAKPSNIALVLGANYKTILANIKPYDIEIIHNKDWQNGIGNSIAIGVRHILEDHPGTDAILIMLADQPLIDSNYIAHLISKYKPNDTHIIATHYSNNKLGVPAIFDKTYFNALANLKNDQGAKQIIKKYSDKVSSEITDLDFRDIDTLEDYELLYSSNHQ